MCAPRNRRQASRINVAGAAIISRLASNNGGGVGGMASAVNGVKIGGGLAAAQAKRRAKIMAWRRRQSKESEKRRRRNGVGMIDEGEPWRHGCAVRGARVTAQRRALSRMACRVAAPRCSGAA